MAAPLKASICFLLGKIEIDERTVILLQEANAVAGADI